MTVEVHMEPKARLELNRFGLWLFILSETMIFLALLTARFFLTGTEVPPEADQVIALIITSILLLSSGSAYVAEVAAINGDEALFRRAMLATMILGLVFLVGVGFEWREAFHAFPPGTVYGSAFFVMTGTHAFHVVTGVLFLWIVFTRSKGNLDANHWPVEASVKYWHFVDVVWVFFYPALYLIS
jgi:cytochrome c oxidase subunit 3